MTCNMSSNMISKRASKMWLNLDNAKKEHGKNSFQYYNAMEKWVQFLRDESNNTRKKVDADVRNFRKAWDNIRKVSDQFGYDSSEFEKAEKKFVVAENKITKTMETIDPLYSAVMSL